MSPYGSDDPATDTLEVARWGRNGALYGDKRRDSHRTRNETTLGWLGVTIWQGLVSGLPLTSRKVAHD